MQAPTCIITGLKASAAKILVFNSTAHLQKNLSSVFNCPVLLRAVDVRNKPKV